MTGYLARLKAANLVDAPLSTLPKLPKGASGGNDSSPSSVFSEVAANEVPFNAARSWRVAYPNLPPMEVIFTSDATRAEVEAIYPSATIERLPDPPRRTATPIEAGELRELVDKVLAEAPEANRAEAFAAALADVDDALVCYRRLAAKFTP